MKWWPVLALALAAAPLVGADASVRPGYALVGVGVARPPLLADVDGDGTEDFIFPSAHRSKPSTLANLVENFGSNPRVFLHLCNRALSCSGKDGKILWEFENPGALAMVLHAEKTRRLVLTSGKGKVLGLDTGTGKAAWTWTVPGGSILDFDSAEDTVFFATTRGALAALDAGSGAVLWTREVPFPGGWGGGRIPLRSCGKILAAATREGRIIGLSARSGDQLWTSESEGGASLVEGDPTLVLVAGKRSLRALSPTDGKILWSADIRSALAYSPVLRVGSTLICLEDSEGELRIAGVSPTDGTTNWRVKISTAPRFLGSRVWGCLTKDGSVIGWKGADAVSVDPVDGKVRWTHRSETELMAVPLVAGDRAGLMPMGRGLVVLDAGSGKVAWTRKDATGAGKVVAEWEDANDVIAVDRRFWVFQGGIRVLDAKDGAPCGTIPAGGAFTMVGKTGNFVILSGHGTYIIPTDEHGDPIR